MSRPREGERILGPYHEPGRQRWRVVEVACDGTRTSSFHRSEAIARKYVELLEASIEQIEHTATTAIEKYKRFLTQKGNKPRSIERTVWALAEFFPKPLALANLKAPRCKGLYDDLRTRPKRLQVKGEWIRPDEGPPLSADSHRGALKEAKSFLTWCVEQGWLSENPAQDIKPIGKLRPRGKSLGKSGAKLRIKEARAFFATALEQARAGNVGAAAALMGLLLGLRASEIGVRRVRDLDTDEHEGDVLHVEDRKNGEDLALEVPQELRSVLLDLAAGKEPDAYLFGRPHSRWWVREQVQRICADAGVPEITAHALRGLLATLTMERGMAGHLVAATLGHDEKMTRTAYAEPGAAEAGERRAGLKVIAGGKA